VNANEIIRRPLVTEKSSRLNEKPDENDEQDNKSRKAKAKAAKEKDKAAVMVFEVDPAANKIQVKEAVEKLFAVKVEQVRLFNVRGKVKRLGRYEGKKRDWRKAYVRLKKGEKAPDFIEGV
jgi:large subunit ribosomal protein L23